MALKFFNKCKRAAPPCKHRDSPSDTAGVKHRTPAVIRTASPFWRGRAAEGPFLFKHGGQSRFRRYPQFPAPWRGAPALGARESECIFGFVV